MPETLYCVVCGEDIGNQGAGSASWGPVSVYYHGWCRDLYWGRVAPRLRDAIMHALDRWRIQRTDEQRSQRSTTDREPRNQ